MQSAVQAHEDATKQFSTLIASDTNTLIDLYAEHSNRKADLVGKRTDEDIYNRTYSEVLCQMLTITIIHRLLESRGYAAGSRNELTTWEKS